MQIAKFIFATQLSVTATTLEALRSVTGDTIKVTGDPAVNFKKTVGDVNLLANPRIRVRNNEKAKVHVGDKVPVITTTSTANVGVSQSVQYVDVGLKLEVEPRIALDDHVNIKVAREVASIVKEIDSTKSGGGLFYQIGTRNASTLLRLKDGETQVLAGLISDDERKNASRLPGLGDIPLIGRLFSSQKDERNKTEIVLAITPRVINNLLRPESEIQEYWSGTETGITDRPQIVVPAGGAAGGAGLPQRAPAPARPQPEPAREAPAPEPAVAAPAPAEAAAPAVAPTDAAAPATAPQ